jgi:hypothetical protein
MNNNLYHVIVSNACPSTVTSASAVLTANSIAVINTQPVAAVTCEGNDVSFNVTATGAGVTYQWQLNTNGTTFNDIPGATSAGLNVTNVTSGMNQDIYRVQVTSCGTVTSAEVTLTVNPLPVVSITASPYTRLHSDLETTLTATANPPATTFSWFKNDNIITGANGNSILVDYSGLGEYIASVTDANGCTGISNTINITDSLISTAFISPNPSTGLFNIRFNNGATGPQIRIIKISNSIGQRVYAKTYPAVSGSEALEVDISHLPSGTYMVELYDASGKRLKAGKVIRL